MSRSQKCLSLNYYAALGQTASSERLTRAELRASGVARRVPEPLRRTGGTTVTLTLLGEFYFANVCLTHTCLKKVIVKFRIMCYNSTDKNVRACFALFEGLKACGICNQKQKADTISVNCIVVKMMNRMAVTLFPHNQTACESLFLIE